MNSLIRSDFRSHPMVKRVEKRLGPRGVLMVLELIEMDMTAKAEGRDALGWEEVMTALDMDLTLHWLINLGFLQEYADDGWWRVVMNPPITMPVPEQLASE